MLVTSVLVILSGLLATTIAIPAPVAEQVEARAALLTSWQAAGGCSTSWAVRCRPQCIGEGVSDHGCNKDDVHPSIQSSHCWIGFNVCECHC